MSGAKNCPETPRQKMIGMMYLVLTAMLALNVSAEIINGFDKLRGSMEKSMTATSQRTDAKMKDFEYAMKDEAGRARCQEWYDIAKAMETKSNEFYDYLEQFKLDIVKMVDGDEMDSIPNTLKGGSDTNKPHQYAFNMTDKNSGKINAEELKARMEDYVNYMTTPDSKCVQDRMGREDFRRELERKTEMIKTLFNTDDVRNAEGQNVAWAEQIFHEMPAAAVMAMLVKYQNDVRTVEFDMIQFMFAQTSASSHVTNYTEAVVIPTNGEYILKGGQYRAKIAAAMMDTNAKPHVFIDGVELEDGVYIANTTTPGPKTYEGYLKLDDDTTKYGFWGQYMVGEPNATVSNVDLDIMYREYNNKFDISVPGVDQSKISLSAQGASVRKEGKYFVCRITDPNAKKITLTVIADIDGRKQTMNTLTYRAKNLPQASAYLTNGDRPYVEGASVPAARWNTKATVSAGYGEDGLLELGWTVTSFKLEVGGSEYAAQGNKLTADMVQKISKVKAGTTVTIKNIRAKAEGSSKDVGLPSLTLKTAY